MENKAVMLLPELFQTNFELFNNLENNIKLEQIKKINYIETIASQLEKNIDSVNLLELFPSNNNNQLTCTETEINKILVKFNPEKQAPIQKLSKKQIENIKEASNYWNNSVRRSMEGEVEQLNKIIENYYTLINELMIDKLSKMNTLKQLVNGDGELLKKQIENILETKKYKLVRIDKEKIIFEYLNDVVIKHINPKANIDIRVNLGKFQIVIFWNGFCPKLEPIGNNLEIRQYFHPHFSSEGSPCLGNLKEVMHRAQEEKNIHKVLDITESLMFNYNDDNPYIELYEFAVKSGQIQANGEIVERESPEYYEVGCPNCGNHQEVELDISGYWEGDCKDCGDYFDYQY